MPAPRAAASVVLLLACCSCVVAGSSRETCELWAVHDTGGYGLMQCGTRWPQTADNVTVCVDGTGFRPDVAKLLVRSTQETGQPVRIHSAAGCEASPAATSESGIIVHCHDEFFNHSVHLRAPDLATADAFYVGRLLLPTALYRPGGVVRGVAFLREQTNQYTRSLRVLEPRELNDFAITVEDASGQEIAVFDADNLELTDNAALLSFELQVSQFWAPGPYSLVLSMNSMSIDSVPITVGHHSKHAIRTTLEAEEDWATLGASIGVSINASYLFGAPLVLAEATLRTDPEIAPPVRVPLIAGQGKAKLKVPEAMDTKANVTVHIAVVDAAGRTGESEASIQIVPSEYRGSYSSLPVSVRPNGTAHLRISALHRRTSLTPDAGHVNLHVKKQGFSSGSSSGTYADVCKDVCASVSVCAKFDGKPDECNKQAGCAYYDNVHARWCDPVGCVQCEEAAKKPWSFDTTIELQNGSATIDLPFAGEGEYVVIADLHVENLSLGAEKWSLKVVKPLHSASSTPDASHGASEEPPSAAAQSVPEQLKLASVEARGGVLHGKVELEGFPGVRRVFVDAYTFNWSASQELQVEGSANFELPLGDLHSQTVRVDAYLDPLPHDSVNAFFSQQGDYESYSGVGQIEEVDLGSTAATSTVYVGTPRCIASVVHRNDALFTGDSLDVQLEVSQECVGGYASLLLVDEGLPPPPAAPDLETPPPLAPAVTNTGRIAPRNDVTVSSGIAPSCVSSLPAVITISGWGLSDDGQTPPEVTVGGEPCSVVEMRRVFVQRSTISSRGKWVRWVSCMANATGRVDVSVPGKRFECTGQCQLEQRSRCPAGDVRGQRVELCDRWMGTKETCGSTLVSNEKSLDGPVVGIDLGTTHSCVGIYKNGRVEIIPNDQGDRITPSYVAFADNEVLVGAEAMGVKKLATSQIVYDAKRLIGRRFNDKSVQEDIKMFTFGVVDKANKPIISLNVSGKEKLVSPEEVSARVLAKMKDVAENYLGKEVRQAVVTVPAYFNDAQRQSTKDAATIAGLDALRIINEPTAAAIAYGLDKKTEQNLIVYDLGGGTHDVSLLTIDNGVFEVVTTAGDTHLGGEDFNERVMKYMLKKLESKGMKGVENNTKAVYRLRLEVEKAKRALSSTHQYRIDLDSLHNGIDFSELLTRARFEELNRDLFKKTIPPVQQVLDDAGLKKEQIHEIVLVGGSTRIPYVQQLVRNFFDGREPNRGINPDEAVAYGAAVQAGIMIGEGGQDLLLLDVTPLTLGIALRNGTMMKLIGRNTVIPTKRSFSIPGELLPQSHMHSSCTLKVYEGEFPNASKNHFLGKFSFDLCDNMVEVTFEIDSNGILNVGGENKGTGKSEKMTVTNDKGRLTEDQIEQMIKAAELGEDVPFQSFVGAENLAEAEIASDEEDDDDIDDIEITTVERADFRESIVVAPVLLEQQLTNMTVTMPDAVTSWALRAVVATAGDLSQASAQQPVLVVNPVFSQTTNPPFMTLHDELFVSTVVENTLKTWLRNVSVRVSHDSTLDVHCANCSGELEQHIGDLAPGSQGVAWWRIRAMKVGDAAFNTTVSVAKPAFQETSLLQTPLRVGPPGSPQVTANRGHMVRGQTLAVDADILDVDVYAEARINFLLGYDAGQMALEGVDSLAQYPYGCCEQTVSSTFPNLVALRYLDAKKNHTRRHELLSNLRNGRDRLVNQFMQASGGFAMWPGADQKPTALHTAMAMGLLGAMKEAVHVPPSALQQGTAYLRSIQNADGSYPLLSGHSANSQDLSATAYVLHSQALAGERDDAAFRYLFKKQSELDAASLALIARAAALLKLGSEEDRAMLITKLRELRTCDSRTGLCHWPRGRAMSSAVETTAYAISAHALIGSPSTDVEPALRWLLSKRQVNGWETTIDTLWAAYALAEVITMPAPSHGNLTVTVDGEIVQRIEVTQATRRKAAAMSRDMHFPLASGSHHIDVAWDGDGEAHCVAEVRRWRPHVAAHWVNIEQSARLRRAGALRGGASRWAVDFSVSLAPNTSDWRHEEAHTAVMIEVPIPAGTSLPDASFHSLRSLPFVEHLELNDKGERPVIGLFVSDLSTSLTLSMEFHGEGEASISVGGLRVLPMYQPEHAVVGATKHLSISKASLELGEVRSEVVI